MSGGKKARGCEASREEWEAYIRENAVALVEARNEQIARLRAEVTRLARRAGALTAERDALRHDVLAAFDRIDGQRDILKRHETKLEAQEVELDRLREAVKAFLDEWERLYRNYDDRYIVCSLAAAVRDSLRAALTKEGITP